MPKPVLMGVDQARWHRPLFRVYHPETPDVRAVLMGVDQARNPEIRLPPSV